MTALNPANLPLIGTQWIEASAGTGKTYTITSLYLRLLLERELSVREILVVTFTEAATAELRARVRHRLYAAQSILTELKEEDSPAVRQRLSEGKEKNDLTLLLPAIDRHGVHRCHERLARALATLDDAQIFTIHGFCQRLLGEFAFEVGARLDLELTGDLRAVLLELVQDYVTRELYAAPEAIVGHWKQAGLKELLDVAKSVAMFPEIELVPRVDWTPELLRASLQEAEEALQGYFEERKVFAREWPTVRASVKRYLETARHLNKNSYSARNVPNWLAKLDALGLEPDGWVSDSFPKQLRPEAWLGQEPCTGAVPLQRLTEAEDAAEESLERARIAFLTGVAILVREELPKRKRAYQVRTFDDLLQEVHAALERDQEGKLAKFIRQRYQAALIDEFQDTDPTQYGIFKTLFGQESSLFLIGDPKQAIYGFRGADVFAYLKASSELGHSRHSLATNFRSDPGLVSTINFLFQRLPRPFLVEGIEYETLEARPGARDSVTTQGGRAPLPAVRLRTLNEATAQAKKGGQRRVRAEPAVASDIARMLSEGFEIDTRPVRPGDFAVLTRTNHQASKVQAELAKLRIPSVLHGDSSVFDAPEARELSFVLQALAEPQSQRAVSAALSTRIFGYTSERLWEVREEEQHWEAWFERFHRWSESWRERGLYQAVRELLHEERLHERILGSSGGERCLTNLLHLAELLQYQAITNHLGVSGTLAWFHEMRHDPVSRGDMAPEAQQIRLESDADAVQLSTVHRSKGLEYNIVYCADLAETFHINKPTRFRYHDPNQGNRLKLDIHREPPEEAKDVYANEQNAESMRLLYVALTRARHQLIILWNRGQYFERSSLAYLLHAVADDPTETPQKLAKVIRDRSAEELRRSLELLSQQVNDTLEVSSMNVEAGAPEYQPQAAQVELEPERGVTRKFEMIRRISSFTALVRQPLLRTLAPFELGRASDEEQTGEAAPPAKLKGGHAITLAEFPKGAAAGNLLHSILERIDFERPARATVEAVVEDQLLKYGRSVSEFRSSLVSAIDEVLETPLLSAPSSLCLSKVARTRRVSELEFTLPLSEKETGRLDVQKLYAAFEPWVKAGGVGPDYLAELRRLNFAPVQGFLRGFIDLVFEHQGLYYLVDFKSNYLGPSYEDYRPEALSPSMAGHHYLLQYHLYAVALHRYLRRRVSGYHYEQHFGGVLYLFLRGMSPARGPSTGVFFDRPAVGLIDSLDVLFAKATLGVQKGAA